MSRIRTLLQPSAFSLGDLCVPPMANVLKVFLENGQTKSFKYDNTTTVQVIKNFFFVEFYFKLKCLFSLDFFFNYFHFVCELHTLITFSPLSRCSLKDVVTSLRDKLCLNAEEHFSLVLEHVKSLKRNKLTLLDPQETLARVRFFFMCRPQSCVLYSLSRIYLLRATSATLSLEHIFTTWQKCVCFMYIVTIRMEFLHFYF